MTQEVMLYANTIEIGTYKSAHFYVLNKSDKELLKLINPNFKTEIVLNGKNRNNSFGFVSHYFYDMFDILVNVYESWELVKKNVSFRLFNGKLSAQNAIILFTIIDGMKTNIPENYF